MVSRASAPVLMSIVRNLIRTIVNFIRNTWASKANVTLVELLDAHLKKQAISLSESELETLASKLREGTNAEQLYKIVDKSLNRVDSHDKRRNELLRNPEFWSSISSEFKHKSYQHKATLIATGFMVVVLLATVSFLVSSHYSHDLKKSHLEDRTTQKEEQLKELSTEALGLANHVWEVVGKLHLSKLETDASDNLERVDLRIEDFSFSHEQVERIEEFRNHLARVASERSIDAQALTEFSSFLEALLAIRDRDFVGMQDALPDVMVAQYYNRTRTGITPRFGLLSLKVLADYLCKDFHGVCRTMELVQEPKTEVSPLILRMHVSALARIGLLDESRILVSKYFSDPEHQGPFHTLSVLCLRHALSLDDPNSTIDDVEKLYIDAADFGEEVLSRDEVASNERSEIIDQLYELNFDRVLSMGEQVLPVAQQFDAKYRSEIEDHTTGVATINAARFDFIVGKTLFVANRNIIECKAILQRAVDTLRVVSPDSFDCAQAIAFLGTLTYSTNEYSSAFALFQEADNILSRQPSDVDSLTIRRQREALGRFKEAAQRQLNRP